MDKTCYMATHTHVDAIGRCRTCGDMKPEGWDKAAREVLVVETVKPQIEGWDGEMGERREKLEGQGKPVGPTVEQYGTKITYPAEVVGVAGGAVEEVLGREKWTDTVKAAVRVAGAVAETAGSAAPVDLHGVLDRPTVMGPSRTEAALEGILGELKELNRRLVLIEARL